MLYAYHHQRWFVMLILVLQGPKDLSKVYKLLCTAEADQAKQEYLEFMSSVVVTTKEKFLLFDKEKDGLNSFMGSSMEGNSDFVNFWKVFRIVFVLSHFQGDGVLISMVNCLLKTWRSYRDLHNYLIDKKCCCLAAKGALIKYDSYLKNEKKNQVVTEKSRKRKLLMRFC